MGDAEGHAKPSLHPAANLLLLPVVRMSMLMLRLNPNAERSFVPWPEVLLRRDRARTVRGGTVPQGNLTASGECRSTDAAG